MNTERKSIPRRVLDALDTARRIVVNVIFILLILFVVALLAGGEPRIEVDDGIAVLFDPVGEVVEEFDADPVDRAMNRLFGTDIPQVRLRDLRAALQYAAEDSRVAAIALDLSALQPVRLSKLQELAEPLALARANGKRVVVYSDAYDQSHYFLAAHADEVSMHPMGGVLIEGYSAYRLYMREALDRLSIDWHVFKAGDFKSYGEPYERNEMSPQVREETAQWLGGMWSLYRGGVESARGLDEGAVDRYVAGMVDGVRDAGGDLSVYAVNAGLVDQRARYDEFVARVRDIVGTDDADDEAFHGLGWESYLSAVRSERMSELASRDRIALLTAQGAIVEGDPGRHVVGAERIVALLADARDDARVKALVLRVDSPGGSAFASEQIRTELDRFRESGKPVVVSMSSVAASGGYWISMSADEVWASPASITGSIGVIAMFPTVDRGLARLGLRSDGVGTTPLAGGASLERPLGPEVSQLVQLLVDGIYSDFLNKVADARGMEVPAVDAIAGGRVWSGAAAQELGLVDSLGGLDDAIDAAAALAGLDEFAVQVLERAPTFRERMLLSFLESRAVAPLGRLVARAERRPLARLLGELERQLAPLGAALDRRDAYLHCLCVAP